MTDFTIAAVHFANNIGRHNEGDGLYFCAEVLGITFTSNLFHNTASNGIGGLGDRPGGDRLNVVSNDVCRAHGHHGIYANGGGGNLITGNQCHGNLQGGIRVIGQDTQVMANGGNMGR